MTPSCVGKCLRLTFSSDMEEAMFETGKSLSAISKFNSVIEKINQSTFKQTEWEVSMLRLIIMMFNIKPSKHVKINMLNNIDTHKDTLFAPRVCSSCVTCGWGPRMHGAINDALQREILHHENDREWLTNNAAHETCMPHPGNYRAVLPGTNKERN